MSMTSSTRTRHFSTNPAMYQLYLHQPWNPQMYTHTHTENRNLISAGEVSDELKFDFISCRVCAVCTSIKQLLCHANMLLNLDGFNILFQNSMLSLNKTKFLTWEKVFGCEWDEICRIWKSSNKHWKVTFMLWQIESRFETYRQFVSFSSNLVAHVERDHEGHFKS